MGHRVLPAGTYLIGDPAYIHEDARWSEICDYLDAHRSFPKELDGDEIIMIRTAHGDGLFADQFGTEYPVASGILGATPYWYWFVEPPKGLGLVFLEEFEEDFECYDDDGVIVIGHLRIDTNIRAGS